jgi:hypothetical protein
MDASLEILIQIREEIAGLQRTQAGIAKTKQDADSLGGTLKSTFAQFTGATLAANGIMMLTRTLNQSVAAMFLHAKQAQDMSQRLGITTRAYQVLADTIRRTGGDVGALAQAFTAEEAALYNARTGVGASAAAYRTLNLEVERLADLSRERRLAAVAEAIGRSSDKQAAWQAASEILGRRSIPALRGALGELAQGYDVVAAKADAAGRIMSDATIARLDRARQTWENVRNAITVQSAELFSAMTGGPAGMSIYAARMFNPQLRALMDTPAPPPQDPDAAARAARQAALRQADLAVELAALQRGLIESDPLRSDHSIRQDLLTGGLQAEIEARKARLEIIRQTDLAEDETAESRQLRLARESAAITELNRQYWDLRLPKDARQRAGEAFGSVNDPERNTNYLATADALPVATMRFLTTLGSTGEQVANIIEGSLGAALSSVSNDIWEAMKGTQAWGQTWRNLGDIAGRMLTQIITQMLVMRSLNAALGIFGYGISGGGGPSVVKAAGGGSFITHGPTSFTVGDNPGGMELVQVTPLSGIGQTTVNGRNLAMAGGGSALVAGAATRGGGDQAPVVVHQTINVSTGVQETVRAEIIGMMPQLKAASVDAVQEAQARGRLRI